MNLLKRVFNAWRNSRFRQYELRLAAADADLRDAGVKFRIMQRAIDGLNAMIAELVAEKRALEERNVDLTELAFRQAERVAQLELDLMEASSGVPASEDASP